MKTKLTKTQKELIIKCLKRGSVGVTMSWGRGPQGGKVSDGARKLQAAQKLVDMGIFKSTSEPQEFPDRIPNNGFTIFQYHYSYELVDKTRFRLTNS